MKRLTLVAGLALMVACQGAVSEPGGEVVTLSQVSGDDQLGKPGSPLLQALVVEATDASRNALTGQQITWRVTGGGGAVSGSGTTDAEGRASATWTLGPAEGVQGVEAVTGAGSRVAFKSRAVERARPVAFTSSAGTVSLMNPDGSDVVQLSTLIASAAAWAPDGSRLAFIAGGPTNCSARFGDLFVVDVGTMTETQLTHHDPCALVESPAWSPDGRQIALVRNKEIVVINADGGGERSIAITDGVDPAVTFVVRSLVWDPDGSAFLFGRRSTVNGPYSLMRINADGSGLSQLTDLFNASPLTFSPDGSRLAIMQQMPQFSYNLSVLLTKPDGTEQQEVVGSSGIGGLAWSPEGDQWLATVWVSGSCGGGSRLVMYDVAGNQATPKGAGWDCGTGSAAWRP